MHNHTKEGVSIHRTVCARSCLLVHLHMCTHVRGSPRWWCLSPCVFKNSSFTEPKPRCWARLSWTASLRNLPVSSFFVLGLQAQATTAGFFTWVFTQARTQAFIYPASSLLNEPFPQPEFHGSSGIRMEEGAWPCWEGVVRILASGTYFLDSFQ